MVTEALVGIFCHVGIPKEVLSDRGTQFTSGMMDETFRLFSVKGLNTTPWHPMCNVLCERFNGTLKEMLKRLDAEQPKEWPRYVAPLLFAYREAPQSTLKFSPFELLNGRAVRGPLQVLRELWDEDVPSLEVSTTYEYVMNLAGRHRETCRMAKEEVLKAQEVQKAHYDRNARLRTLQAGQECSGWRSGTSICPMVVVRKKGGSVRICGDFRMVNVVTQIDAEPMSDQQEIFSRLSHSRVFRK
ncbi:uncharacterized protein LOC135110819 [Scylla paramamosain]|uniref:uncharacterized protein LOC135110819 n=1 Tax=Scylla paramamosain TaxID=85552 RepID=UPI0030837BB3